MYLIPNSNSLPQLRSVFLWTGVRGGATRRNPAGNSHAKRSDWRRHAWSVFPRDPVPARQRQGRSKSLKTITDLSHCGEFFRKGKKDGDEANFCEN